MSHSKQEGPGDREPACMLCRRAEADRDICGDKLEDCGVCAHEFCLFFATLLFRQDDDFLGFVGFFPRDIQFAVRQAAQKHCCVCGQSGATIMCCKEDCDRWFHLPCAKEGGCVTQYIPDYSSFCPEHSPEQDVEATPEPGTDCLICMEPVEDRKTFRTLVCPACKRAWFHRDCIQGQAMCAGALAFQCPLCRDKAAFTLEMFTMGIRIPFRDPAWEDNYAFADLGERHSRCTARDCLYPGGREDAEEEGPWELLLCSSCAAEGTHRRCSGLRNRVESWECDSCAGLGTASRVELELSGPSLTRQSGLEPAHGSSAPEAISPSSSTLVPSGLDPQSPSAEPSSSHQHTVWLQSLLSSSLDTSNPSTSSSTYSTSSDPEDRVHSRRAGPGCRPTRSRQQGRAPDGPVRSRSPCDRSRRTTTRTERPRPRETPSRASPRRSRACQQGQAQSPPVRSRSPCDRSSRTRPRTERPRPRETSSGTSPRRSRSRQQGQAQRPPVRSRSRRDRCHRTTSSAERPRRRETSSGTSPRRSRSRLQRQASNQPVLSRSRQDRSSRTAARAQRPRHSGAPSGVSRRSNRSCLRHRASTGTYNSST
ncbi:PHD finger protein 7-like [Vidua macroura]|uniref:PHD finger protein 7-like n=1 Tax=Vidua macroura TaxID=187451 RepID=UPI0023A83129|nr:PHD finger protein 7-like [Vidua macroura]